MNLFDLVALARKWNFADGDDPRVAPGPYLDKLPCTARIDFRLCGKFALTKLYVEPEYPDEIRDTLVGALGADGGDPAWGAGNEPSFLFVKVERVQPDSWQTLNAWLEELQKIGVPFSIIK